MKLRQPLVLGFTVGLTAVLACACSSGSSSGGSASAAPVSVNLGTAQAKQALEALYSKAVAAGQTSVVIYGPSAGSDQQEYAAFKAAFPKITVSGVPVVGPPMQAKLSAEFASGKHIGDIAYTGGPNMMQYAASGWLAPFAPASISGSSALAADSVGPDNDFYGVTISVAGTVTNSSTVKTPPTQWTDLESPAYKNEIAMYDPTAIGLMDDNFAHLALEPQYSRLEADLKANNAQLFPATSITGPLTAVAQGAKKVAIGMGYNFYMQAKAAGAPIAFSLFTADNYSTSLYDGLIKGAPDPLAAQLYEDWMFTPDAAAAIAAEGSYSTVTGAVAPKGLPALSAIALQTAIPLTQVTAADNAAIVAAKQYWGS
ncbi:MAG TPA: ABC transporter substrate-binding protein [Trebonia sp.]|jgi:iron(III) transport system substrate-binding protein|nr:ABC transporter substrate-binding protein [Trebonia sp.]